MIKDSPTKVLQENEYEIPHTHTKNESIPNTLLPRPPL